MPGGGPDAEPPQLAHYLQAAAPRDILVRMLKNLEEIHRSQGQAARLAAMVPSPRRYGPGQTTAYLQRRTEIILGRMPGARVP